MKINPYLIFNGNCGEAMKFYEKVLGGKISSMMTYGETPAAEHVSPQKRNSIIHARLVFGDNVLMASDDGSEHFEAMKGMSVTVNVDTPAEAERIFKDLADGAKVMMPIQETFWALRYGMLTDRFGTPWMINCEKPQ
jgi:PhnB protein